MSKFEELMESILADGVIDEKEVKEIRDFLYSDGKIDKEEADLLFELNEAVSGKTNHSSWATLFVEAITSFLLEDEMSIGIIDDEKAKWLLAKIQGDGQIDEIEAALLKNLKAKAEKISPLLSN